MKPAPRHRARLGLLMLALFAAVGQAHAQGVTLKAWTDSTSYDIGRWITLRIDGEMPAQIDSLIPVVFDTLGPFEVLYQTQMPLRACWKYCGQF